MRYPHRALDEPGLAAGGGQVWWTGGPVQLPNSSFGAAEDISAGRQWRRDAAAMQLGFSGRLWRACMFCNGAIKVGSRWTMPREARLVLVRFGIGADVNSI